MALVRAEAERLVREVMGSPAPDFTIEYSIGSMQEVRITLDYFDATERCRLTVSRDYERLYRGLVEPSIARSIRKDLAATTMSPAPQFAIGLDGVEHALAVQSGFNRSVLTWWCDVPPGWEGLVAIAERIVEVSRPYLPEPLVLGF